MIDIERLLTISAFTKWILEEDMSMGDIERIAEVFNHKKLNLEIVDPPKAAALQVKLRSILNERFMPKPQGQ